jgi:hypothetical protein
MGVNTIYTETFVATDDVNKNQLDKTQHDAPLKGKIFLIMFKFNFLKIKTRFAFSLMGVDSLRR